MVERKHRFGNLVFDRDAIVRAALRAYFEGIFGNSPLKHLSFPACDDPRWTGDLTRGAFYNGDGSGNYDVVAWTEAGVVGLAYELGWGPIDQLGLSIDAVTGGPDDVRGALPGLPDELEPALVIATPMLFVGNDRERLAGVGFWLLGDRSGGTLFNDPTACGADRLAMWGLLQNGRLLPRLSRSSHPDSKAALAKAALRNAPIQALIDAVVDRRMGGPTELTPEELEILFSSPPDPDDLLFGQRMLQKAGITWPGSPKLPEEPRPTGRNPFLPWP